MDAAYAEGLHSGQLVYTAHIPYLAWAAASIHGAPLLSTALHGSDPHLCSRDLLPGTPPLTCAKPGPARSHHAAAAAVIGAAEAARVYLAGAGQTPPERLPPSVMVAEIRQLRRLLAQVLAEIDGQREEVTG